MEAGLRAALAAILSTGIFLAVSPVISAVSIGGLFAFTVFYANAARRRGEGLLADGQSFPSVPLT
jgi:hypothetical protein